jgi:hypothetical protein
MGIGWVRVGSDLSDPNPTYTLYPDFNAKNGLRLGWGYSSVGIGWV